jgi:anti-sigma B factor antagonist
MMAGAAPLLLRWVSTDGALLLAAGALGMLTALGLPILRPSQRDREELALDVSSETAGAVATYRIVGRIDAATSPKLESTVVSAIGGATPWIIYDMRDVNYMSSAGLRGVLLVAKQAKAARGGLAVFGLQPAVHEVFESAGFDNIIPITADEAQARAALGA